MFQFTSANLIKGIPKRRFISLLYKNRIRTKNGFFSKISQLDILVTFLKGHLDILRSEKYSNVLLALRKRFKYRGSSFSGLIRHILLEVFPTDLDEQKKARQKAEVIYSKIAEGADSLDSFVLSYLTELKDSINAQERIEDDSDKNLIWEE